ncbi:MAG: DMT family transporter [Chloroflexi bacterium]|nr:DMT family transporter [Chloroflexota bacterium]MBV9599673.1 DMT family transporter [Chloroflexota bacterium]
MRLLPIAMLVFANALWGSSYVVAKIALQEIPPPILAALRFGLATLVLWLIVLARGSVRLPHWRDALRLAALGAFGIGVNGILGYTGVSLTTATDASLLIVGEVLFTTLLAVLLANEQLDAPRGVGLLVGLLGVLVLIAGGASASLAGAPSRALGDVLILVGLAFEATHTVLGTQLSRRYAPLTVLTLTLTGSCLIWLPLLAWYAARGDLQMPSPQASAGVVYLAVVTGVACYLLWFSVLRLAGATVGAMSLMAQPVVGALLGIWLLGDSVTLSTLVGAACVVTCLCLASGAIHLPVARRTRTFPPRP